MGRLGSVDKGLGAAQMAVPVQAHSLDLPLGIALVVLGVRLVVDTSPDIRR